jgi:hypothetical protein
VAGAWTITEDSDGVEARFEDERDALRGFALVGAATANKAALVARLIA